MLGAYIAKNSYRYTNPTIGFAAYPTQDGVSRGPGGTLPNRLQVLERLMTIYNYCFLIFRMYIMFTDIVFLSKRTKDV